ncbi:hypothetical protein CN373_02615 [Bacillus cereus]|nr:hypothetical protein CN373_02615 [Bacillus cereus]PGZ18757.1 hypothetical protein COE46_06030 [Bacillus cereus]
MMKKIITFILFFTIIIVCGIFLLFKTSTKNNIVNSTSDSTSTMEGYIIFKNNNVYFIQNSKINNDNIQSNIEKLKDKNHPSDSILVIDDPDFSIKIKTGDKIKIWVEQILESYPQKLIVTKYEKIKN